MMRVVAPEYFMQDATWTYHFIKLILDLLIATFHRNLLPAGEKQTNRKYCDISVTR